MSTLTEAISIALAQSIWQDIVVAVGLWTALRALHRRSPHLRYIISCAALALMVLWPVLSALRVLAPFAQRLVIDRTDLAGKYNLQLSWTPQGMRTGRTASSRRTTAAAGRSRRRVDRRRHPGTTRLELEPTRAPIDVVVIDRVERPTPD
jgi:uncharacterized protein (TIGR03435 family)